MIILQELVAISLAVVRELKDAFFLSKHVQRCDLQSWANQRVLSIERKLQQRLAPRLVVNLIHTSLPLMKQEPKCQPQ